jgi:hypothetical protein
MPMANQRLINEVAVATSRSILKLFVSCLREEEQRAAMEEIYDAVKAGIEFYELSINRMERRLHPTRN